MWIRKQVAPINAGNHYVMSAQPGDKADTFLQIQSQKNKKRNRTGTLMKLETKHKKSFWVF